jgi:chromate transport protein ChrA
MTMVKTLAAGLLAPVAVWTGVAVLLRVRKVPEPLVILAAGLAVPAMPR